MSGLILVQNESSRALLAKIAESAQQAGISEISIVGAENGLPGFSSYNQSAIHSAIEAALNDLKSSRVTILNLGIFQEASQLSALLSSLSNSQSELTVAQFRRGDDLIAANEGSVEDLIDLLSNNPEWPAMAISADRELALSLIKGQADSISEIIALMLVRGTIQGASIGATPEIFKSSSLELSLSNTAMARLLGIVLSECNIEELFPNHPWDRHQEESAAAAYHALAALFIKFGELSGAAECLALSDQFEDSPRSLALKGMIARLKGETLGAVANMVASLQQYELRKLSNANHFVRFIPRNIEQITVKLQAGLSALNRSENEKALELFSEAVFNFDPFFSQAGLPR